MKEENNKVTEFQAAQEEGAADLQEEQKSEKGLQLAEQERKEHLKKCVVLAIVLAVVLSGLSIFAFNAGRKSVRDEANAEITKMQDEANAKVARLEQKLQQEYIDKKYALIEEQYEVFSTLKDDSMLPEYRIRLSMDRIQWNHGLFLDLEDDALDKLILADVEYPPMFSSEIKEMDDEKALVYIEALKEVAEKYPYSIDINHSVIYRMELLEENCTEQLQKAETFKAIDALKKQCEENMALWEK